MLVLVKRLCTMSSRVFLNSSIVVSFLHVRVVYVDWSLCAVEALYTLIHGCCVVCAVLFCVGGFICPSLLRW